jgi:hypothetical protein
MLPVRVGVEQSQGKYIVGCPDLGWHPGHPAPRRLAGDRAAGRHRMDAPGGIETGGNKRWHEMYQRILNAGKSVQIVNVEPHEVVPLLDAVGNRGVYILIQFRDEKEVEQVLHNIESYYR